MTSPSSFAPCPQSEWWLQAAFVRGDELNKVRKCCPPQWGAIALLLLIALPGLVQAQESSPPKSHSDDDYTISVNVDVVVLHATAQDRRGTLVSGLGKDDFQIYEDGVLQTIKYFSHEDIPVTVGLVVDNSGSMTFEARRRDCRRVGICPLQQPARPDVRDQFQRKGFVWPSGERCVHRPGASIGSCSVETHTRWRNGAVRRRRHRSRSPEERQSRQESSDRDQRRRRQRQ